MKKLNLIATSSLALTLMLGIVATPLSAQESYSPGVTVEKNTNPDWDADYTATFIFEDKDARDATKVSIKGGFQYYWEDETKSYNASGDNTNIPCYDAYHYEKGMFAASSNTQTNDMIAYEMEEISDEVFKLTIPVPANQYFYAYYIEYSDGTKMDKVKDPANMPIINVDSDAGWSLFYVGNGETKGQEYIYPRTDEKKGSVNYLDYTAIDGSTQYVGIYTPYGYNPNKTYKTIYVSHGGGGNEVEWMTIGSIPNIMDNLLANKEMAEAIVVTMDNQYFGWDYDKIVPNVTDYIKPLVEAKYNVSKNASDRAFCGLSMGSMTTNEMLKRVPTEFGYYGAFSGGNPDLDSKNWNSEAMNKATIYLTAGCIDMAYNNNMGISSIDYMKMLDKLNVNYTFELKLGAHDWYVWRDSFTTFAKDYLWPSEKEPEIVPPTPDNQPVITKPNATTAPKTGDNLNASVATLFLLITASAGYIIKFKKFN